MRGMRWHSVRIGSWISIGLLLGAPGAFAGDFAGQITASTGLVEGGQQGTLGEGERVSLGDDGGCSILRKQHDFKGSRRPIAVIIYKTNL